MSNIKTLQRSFSGGEVSPEMFGRIDDVKYQSGAAKMRNFIAKPQGPAANRPGLQFVRAVKDSTKKVRLIPFTYSTTQTMVIELGAGYFRFHTQGSTVMNGSVPYELSNPYAEADLFDIHYVQSADVLTLVHHNHPPKELKRLGATDWTLTDISFSTTVTSPSDVTVTAHGEDTTTDAVEMKYVVTTIAADGISESEQSAVATVTQNIYRTGNYNTISWSSVSNASRYYVYKQQGGIYGYLGNTTDTTINDDNIAPDLSRTPPTYDIAFRPNGIESVPVTSGGSNYGTTYTGGAITGVGVTAGGYGYTSNAYVQISDPTGSGATFTPVINSSGTITAITVNSGGLNYSNPAISIIDPGIESSGGSGAQIGTINISPRDNSVVLSVTDSTGTGAKLAAVVDGGVITRINVIDPGQNYTSPVINITTASGGSGANLGTPILTGTDYPGAVSYFEQRRCFAGTLNQPQNIWMTRSGTESNMSYSLPIRDDDRISFRVAAREANTIRHIVPLTQLLLLTSSAEWRVTSINSDAITPTTISVRPQSYIGASNVQPVIINNNLIYVASRGGHVRECSYSWQASGFITGDLSIRSAHLFDNLDVSDMAYSKAPFPIVWFISNNGKLLGLTYIPEQQIGSWHQHDTDGLFESCTVVAEGNEDILYVVVKRTINGSSVRYVERLASRQFADQTDAFFVDCGLTYSGVPADEISGLSHLEGKTVSILADGAVHPQRVVSGGKVTLDVEASKIHIGLPITADIQTLPLAMQIDSAFGQGRYKNVNKAWLRVFRSSGIFIGPDTENLVEAKQRTTEIYGKAPELKSEELQIMLTPSWSDSGSVFIRQSDPLPLTIVGMTLEVAAGG